MSNKSEIKKSKKQEKTQAKKISQEEFESRVLTLSEKGLTTEKIGEALRREGIHPREHGKKISKILKEKGKYTSPDMKNVKEKLERIKKHFETNKQDKRVMREKGRIFSKLRKLERYHGKAALG